MMSRQKCTENTEFFVTEGQVSLGFSRLQTPAAPWTLDLLLGTIGTLLAKAKSMTWRGKHSTQVKSQEIIYFNLEKGQMLYIRVRLQHISG